MKLNGIDCSKEDIIDALNRIQAQTNNCYIDLNLYSGDSIEIAVIAKALDDFEKKYILEATNV